MLESGHKISQQGEQISFQQTNRLIPLTYNSSYSKVGTVAVQKGRSTEISFAKGLAWKQ